MTDRPFAGEILAKPACPHCHGRGYTLAPYMLGLKTGDLYTITQIEIKLSGRHHPITGMRRQITRTSQRRKECVGKGRVLPIAAPLRIPLQKVQRGLIIGR